MYIYKYNKNHIIRVHSKPIANHGCTDLCPGEDARLIANTVLHLQISELVLLIQVLWDSSIELEM